MFNNNNNNLNRYTSKNNPISSEESTCSGGNHNCESSIVNHHPSVCYVEKGGVASRSSRFCPRYKRHRWTRRFLGTFATFGRKCSEILGIMTSPDVEKNLVDNSLNKDNAAKLYLQRVFAALFYAVSSFLITVVNKVVLTSCGFPSSVILALGQISTTVVVLFLAKSFGLVSFPNLERNSFAKIFPLPLLFLGNAVTGLGGTKELSLPMFTALRRFSILFTMGLERYILEIRPSFAVQVAVHTMVGGALLATFNDLTFSLTGYVLLMLNNIFTASNGVIMKKKLDSKDYGKLGLMFYNALFMLPPLTVFAYLNGDFDKAAEFKDWTSGYFLLNFSLSCLMGFLLNASIVACTFYNSALTTTIVGCLKNISVTYLGMFIGGDYVYQLYNFIGINVSVVGSLLYTYVTFRK